MKQIKKYILKMILFEPVLFILILAIANLILSFFNLMFRKWIYILSPLIIMLSFVIKIMQLLLKIKKKKLKRTLSTLFMIYLLISTPIISLLAIFCIPPEHIIEKDNEKYVAYVNGFLKTYVYYYDYVNAFVVGNQKRIEEYYGKGGFDPLDNKYGYNYQAESIIYYDENGNILSFNE